MTSRRSRALALVVTLAALSAGGVQAMTVSQTNLVGLIKNSRDIVIADVQTVTDGVDAQGFPYTEVTVGVSETLRGENSGTLTFRQFGLSKPRLTEDGTKMMLAAPEGMPTYTEGEHVLLFLGPEASLTGFRSTVGMGQGKFNVDLTRAENETGNQGAFQNVSLDEGLANANDTRILETEGGAVNGNDLLSLVRRATTNRWVETCKMWDTEEGKTCTQTPKQPLKPRPTTTQTHSAPKLSVK